jgi:quercetin dioxygenase-like cupin family protein
MKKINVFAEGQFRDSGFGRLLVHESPYVKALNFNFHAGQELPVHSHDIEGEVVLTVLEGTGEFLGADGATIPAKAGDVLVSEIRVPHGIRAATDMRVLVVIAPPI